MTSVSGLKFTNESEFYAILAEIPFDSWVESEFQRFEYNDVQGKTDNLTISAKVRVSRAGVFDVQFVSQDKKLAVFAELRPPAKVVGHLESGTLCVHYANDTNNVRPDDYAWHRVRHQPSDGLLIEGWVSARYLRPSVKCLK